MILKKKIYQIKSLYHLLLTSLYCLWRFWNEKLGLNKAKDWYRNLALSLGISRDFQTDLSGCAVYGDVEKAPKLSWYVF